MPAQHQQHAAWSRTQPNPSPRPGGKTPAKPLSSRRKSRPRKLSVVEDLKVGGHAPSSQPTRPPSALAEGPELWLLYPLGEFGVELGAPSGPTRGPARPRTGGGTGWRPAALGTTCSKRTACCSCCRTWNLPALARTGAPLAALRDPRLAAPRRLPSTGPSPDPSRRRIRARTPAGETVFPWKSWCIFSGCWLRLMGPCRFLAGTLTAPAGGMDWRTEQVELQRQRAEHLNGYTRVLRHLSPLGAPKSLALRPRRRKLQGQIGCS